MKGYPEIEIIENPEMPDEEPVGHPDPPGEPGEPGVPGVFRLMEVIG